MSAKYLKRYEAVFLVLHAKGPKLTYAQASKVLRKSKSFVEKWVKQYKEVANVDDLPNRGLSRTTREDKTIVRLFERNPTLTLRQARNQLLEKGINIIRRRLYESKIKYRSTIKKPLLTEKHVTKRLAWIYENLSKDWDNVIFTDEASFWAWLPIRKAWSTPSNRIIQQTVKHPVKIHVWGCFCKHGFGCLYLFTDNLNAEKMLKIYQKCLVTSTEKFYGKNRDNSRKITILNIGVVFAQNGKLKMASPQ